MGTMRYANRQVMSFGLNRIGLQFPTEANPIPTLPMSAVLSVVGLPLWQVNKAVGLETELIDKWEGNQ